MRCGCSICVKWSESDTYSERQRVSGGVLLAVCCLPLIHIIYICGDVVETLQIVCYLEIQAEMPRKHMCISYSQAACESFCEVACLYGISHFGKYVCVGNFLECLVSHRREHGHRVVVGLGISVKSYSYSRRPEARHVVARAQTEGVSAHMIFVPFSLQGEWTIKSIAENGMHRAHETICTIADENGNEKELSMIITQPVKVAIEGYEERVRPTDPMVTRIRIIDTFLPVAKGGTYCIPGPFGAGKTVLQHLTSKNADVDIVIIAACGERAGEVVEILKEFPELTDPKTGRSLMERTIIICNTSSMPVAAREASVYTAVTMAEYYRNMGLDVLLLADSTSRWAQAMREMSGRLEEIPGDEAFPAYLESRIAGFYERAGKVRLRDGRTGTVTIGGTVSPAGGNFEEPVTQATLKVVGAFHGLSRERSDARKYPAIDPLDSWSKYNGIIERSLVDDAYGYLRRGHEVGEMMKVVGEEGTSLDDYVLYQKGEFLDAVYLQQNSFDPVDSVVPVDRQKESFSILHSILSASFFFEDKKDARLFFNELRQRFLDWNGTPADSPDFEKRKSDLVSFYEGRVR